MSQGDAIQIIAMASGEVRDQDGNLIETVTGQSARVFTEADLADLGMSPEQIAEIKRTGGFQ